MENMQGCDAQVTVWRREKNNFTREILPVLCRWRKKAERKLEGAGFSGNDGVTLIIPYYAGLVMSPGDLAAPGEHEFEITGVKPFRESDAKAEIPDIITVQRVSYNLSGRGEHLGIDGI